MPGRPTDYKPEYPKLAYRYCLLGATNADLADSFEVSISTIEDWLRDKPLFSRAVKRGKKLADARVAKSLFHRAIGYSHAEDKIFNNNGVAMVVPTVKYYAPDPTAAIFWLKNRDPKNWREKQEVNVSGELQHQHLHVTPDMLQRIGGMSNSELEAGLKVLEQLAQKQLPEGSGE